MILTILLIIATAILYVIVLFGSRKGHARHEYSKSLQTQIDRLRNEHDLLHADSKRLAQAVAHIQTKHLGLPSSEVFHTQLH